MVEREKGRQKKGREGDGRKGEGVMVEERGSKGVCNNYILLIILLCD